MEQDMQVMRGNPFAPDLPVQTTALVEVESARAVAEVQSRLTVAKRFPRDQMVSWQQIMQSCQRIGFAEKAMYQYPRGGQTVRGPSIRLAEALARSWGNMDAGVAELSRSNGASEMEAYCWDLETNTRFSKRFTVNHVRDTKGGGKPLTDERDIYEITANMGARRLRACIIMAIPSDVVADAVEACAATIEKGSGEPLADRAKKMIMAFEQIGVSGALIAQYLKHPIDAIVPDELVTLRGVYTSIKDGNSKVADWFGAAQNASSNAERIAGVASRTTTPTTNGDPLTSFRAELADAVNPAACIEAQKRAIAANDESTHGEIRTATTARLTALKS